MLRKLALTVLLGLSIQVNAAPWQQQFLRMLEVPQKQLGLSEEFFFELIELPKEDFVDRMLRTSGFGCIDLESECREEMQNVSKDFLTMVKKLETDFPAIAILRKDNFAPKNCHPHAFLLEYCLRRIDERAFKNLELRLPARPAGYVKFRYDENEGEKQLINLVIKQKKVSLGDPSSIFQHILDAPVSPEIQCTSFIAMWIQILEEKLRAFFLCNQKSQWRNISDRSRIDYAQHICLAIPVGSNTQYCVHNLRRQAPWNEQIRAENAFKEYINTIEIFKDQDKNSFTFEALLTSVQDWEEKMTQFVEGHKASLVASWHDMYHRIQADFRSRAMESFFRMVETEKLNFHSLRTELASPVEQVASVVHIEEDEDPREILRRYYDCFEKSKKDNYVRFEEEKQNKKIQDEELIKESILRNLVSFQEQQTFIAEEFSLSDLRRYNRTERSVQHFSKHFVPAAAVKKLKFSPFGTTVIALEAFEFCFDTQENSSLRDFFEGTAPYCTAYILPGEHNPVMFIQQLIQKSSVKKERTTEENHVLPSYTAQTSAFDALEFIKDEENNEVIVKKFSARAVRLVVKEGSIHTIFPLR